ncbi:MAG: thiamine ABC transporter substrate-binding protein [Actinomycetaceae bacterium]|nr:thiamine ABC transporter substrate-binding protein [Actinomycetaceae bacterium]
MKRKITTCIAAGVLAIIMGGCGANSPSEGTNSAGNTGPIQKGKGETVTLVAYDSFPTKDIAPGFEKATGYKLKVVAGADGAELTNKLVVTKDNPLGDVALGMDNNVAFTAHEKGVFTPANVKLPQDADKYALKGGGELLPFDRSQYCLNYDAAWFKEKGKQPPSGFADLTKPEYKGLLTVADPRKSTPGMGFLAATIAANGGGETSAWQEFWKQLRANDVLVQPGWTEAFAHFTAGGEGGDKPIMTGYSTSGAYPTGKDGNGNPVYNLKTVESTCYQATEYMGLLAGAKNSEGGRALLDYLLSKAAQEKIAATNYMYPVNDQAAVPAELKEHGKEVPGAPALDPQTVAKNRTVWLKAWADVMGQ